MFRKKKHFTHKILKTLTYALIFHENKIKNKLTRKNHITNSEYYKYAVNVQKLIHTDTHKTPIKHNASISNTNHTT